MTLPTPSNNAVTDGKGIVECVARAICQARGIDPDEPTFGSGSVSTSGSSYTVYERRYDRQKASAEAAIRATLEYLRNHHSATAWCALMDALGVEYDALRGKSIIDGGTITPAIIAFFDAALSELPSHPLNPVTEAEEI